MPPTLPTLFTNANAVYDRYGTEGVDLRLDDHGEATGQTIRATATALTGATTLSITALQTGILRGDTLQFDGGGMAAVVGVTLTAAAPVGATSLTVLPLTGDVNGQAMAFDSGVNIALAARLNEGCKIGTAKVMLYCCARYDASVLAQSYSVYNWATIAACKWIGSRRGQSPPSSIVSDYEEAIDEMKQVQKGQLLIESIGTRTSDFPFFSNITVDPSYPFIKARVELPISEQTPTNYWQYPDWASYWGVWQ